MARLVNSNTVLLVGSAPNFPHGIVDDIPALSKLAVRRGVPLHVDCCLGSFLMPFLERAGFETVLVRLPPPRGDAISCDTHKYGFAPKGNSTVLYRTQALRAYQYFVSPDWTGGVYASVGVAGSRPGALIAACWASMMRVGEAGYLDACVRIVGAARKLADRIRDSPALAGELEVLGRPLVSVVAFRARTLNVYDLADAMRRRGWHLNALQNPPAIHVAVTMPITKAWERLVADLEACVEARAGEGARARRRGQGRQGRRPRRHHGAVRRGRQPAEQGRRRRPGEGLLGHALQGMSISWDSGDRRGRQMPDQSCVCVCVYNIS